jgi:hypothetical protein
MHSFIFEDGLWIGEGKITFSASPDHIRFYTRWTRVNEIDPDSHKWLQEIEMQGTDERVGNTLHFMPLTDKTFSLSLSNDIVGKAIGKGVIDAGKIAWELKNPDTFQGFEVYELQENGDYQVHAEYAAADNFRTIIDGRIWKKSV